VILFAKRHLARHHGSDLVNAELRQFYAVAASTGELEPLTKQKFLRALPGALAATFGLGKGQSIERDRQARLGFKWVTIREDAHSVTPLEFEPK
jgi:hypothetical protein